MDVILPIRCFSRFLLLTRHGSPPPDLIVSAKTHLPGKLVSLLLDAEKYDSSTIDASSAASVLLCKYPASKDMGQNSLSNGCVNMIQLPSGTRSTLAIFLANSLMFTSPMEALAETCEADNSFNMPLLLVVALVGATVGGLVARQRKGELKRLNEQLRQINASLRRQAKIESYAPNLSYAPVGSSIIAESEVIVDQRKQELIPRLKAGKNFLRMQDHAKAFAEFKDALELAQILNDRIEEKKAARGLGASLQRQGKYEEAIITPWFVKSPSKEERTPATRRPTVQ